jgi:hypothetical protein
MDSLNPSIAVSNVTCEHCKAKNDSDKKFCSQCRFPMAGTDEEKSRFRSDVAKHLILLKDAEDRINKARNIILILAGLFVLFGVITFFGQEDTAGAVVNVLIAILYLGLAAWCRSNPFGAILTAFIVYLTVQLVNAFVDPATLLGGIIWKVIFIGAFVKGIQAASEARPLIKELEKAKVEPVGTYY